MLGQSVNVMESAPRQASRQQHRQNIPSDTITDYYKCNFTIPILDHLISELAVRFNDDSAQYVVEFMRLLPAEVVNKSSQLQPEDFNNLLQLYKEDLPSVRSFDVELDLWQNKWTGEPQLASELDTPGKVLAHTDYDYYPNIHTLITIVATLPITSCECERSISMLRLFKTALRSIMSEDRLNGLAMLQYHRDISIEADEVVKEFVQRHPRRLMLANPFTE